MFTRSLKAKILLIFIVTGAFAGERGPGEYSGVVVFDNWDTCYISSGAYLMYISEKRKESLRKYAGQAIRLDAKEVLQPLNPGDGLITSFDFLGPAKVIENLPKVEGLELIVRQISESGKRVELDLTLSNKSDDEIAVEVGELAQTLLGVKNVDSPLSPSDGASEAKVTRCTLKDVGDFSTAHTITKWIRPDRAEEIFESFSVRVVSRSAFPGSIQIPPKQVRHLMISLILAAPQGEYDFLFGYGGGVHEGKGLTSNLISFSIDKKGNAHAIRKAPVITPYRSGLMDVILSSLGPSKLFPTFETL